MSILMTAFDLCCNSSNRTTQAWFIAGPGQDTLGRQSEISSVRSAVMNLVMDFSQWQRLQAEHFQFAIHLGLYSVGGTWLLLSR